MDKAIYSRRAVREFTDEPVDEKTLRQLIDAAIQAPSAVNQQPWSFSVVLDKALRISREAKAHMLKATPTGLLSHSHHFQEILNDPKFNIFDHAPALIVFRWLRKARGSLKTVLWRPRI
jgi:nitroreductase